MLDRRDAASVQLADKKRMFQIEGGAIVFDTPDPADPRLDVRASWRSPDDQRRFVHVRDRHADSKPKILFDRPQQDALSMLGSSTAGTGAANIGISALDSLLAGTPLARVQLRGARTAPTMAPLKGAMTYTAAYRASDRVIVEGNYQAAGSLNPEEQSMVGAAVDYRMTKTVSSAERSSGRSVRAWIWSISIVTKLSGLRAAHLKSTVSVKPMFASQPRGILSAWGDAGDRDEQRLAGHCGQAFGGNNTDSTDELTEATGVELDDGRRVFAAPSQGGGQGLAGSQAVAPKQVLLGLSASSRAPGKNSALHSTKALCA